MTPILGGNMENKNVKVIDEHGIDRTANIICGFVVDDKKYVLYSIGRDDESDNIFVSKIVDNIDKTSNMVNIDDDTEKTKIGSLVKELVTYSLKNEEDHAEKRIAIDGKEIEITNVLFNKEQNINVTKTYVATVKKSVTKVSEKFYKVESSKEDDLDKTTIFETLPENAITAVPVAAETELKMAMPEINLEAEEPKVEGSQMPTELPKEEPVLETESPKTESLASTFVIPPVGEDKPKEQELKLPTELFNGVVTEENKPATPVEPVIPQPEVSTEPISIPEVKTVIESPATPVEPIKEEPVTTEQAPLSFNGASESNLIKALDEASDKNVTVTQADGVQSLREFGEDAPADNTGDVLPTQKNSGFANNKFFMVIAIAFFLAACVFLGYEAFQYFGLK